MIYVTSGGGTGATLVVTGVAGDTCTISKDGKSKTQTFNSDGKATFNGVSSGTWTVTMTSASGSTATRTVAVNADYTLTIAYFSATINVTYPAGSTCTATDGSTTLTAPDATGTWVCVVPNAGTWTVTATLGSNTVSKAVTLTTLGQSASVTLTYELNLLAIPENSWNKYLASSTAEWLANGNLKLTQTSNPNGSRWTVLTPLVDLTKYKTLQLEVQHVSGTETSMLMGVSKLNQYQSTGAAATKSFSNTGRYELDISNLSGEYYCGLYAEHNNNTHVELVVGFKLI